MRHKASLADLFEAKEVQKLFLDLSKFSFEMILTGKVIFTQDEMNKPGIAGNSFIDTETHGFIVKEKNDYEGNIYQFRHLTLQEFFAALYIFHKRPSFSSLMKKNCRNSEISSILAGLEGSQSQPERA